MQRLILQKIVLMVVAVSASVCTQANVVVFSNGVRRTDLQFRQYSGHNRSFIFENSQGQIEVFSQRQIREVLELVKPSPTIPSTIQQVNPTAAAPPVRVHPSPTPISAPPRPQQHPTAVPSPPLTQPFPPLAPSTAHSPSRAIPPLVPYQANARPTASATPPKITIAPVGQPDDPPPVTPIPSLVPGSALVGIQIAQLVDRPPHLLGYFLTGTPETLQPELQDIQSRLRLLSKARAGVEREVVDGYIELLSEVAAYWEIPHRLRVEITPGAAVLPQPSTLQEMVVRERYQQRLRLEQQWRKLETQRKQLGW